MWRFSNFNSNYALCPPDTGQNQHPDSLVYLTYDNLCGCFPENANSPSPAFGAQSCSPPLNPAFVHQLGWEALDRANENVGLGDLTPATKRFLVFGHCGDQTSLIYGSAASPYQMLSPPPPPPAAGNVTHEGGSSSLVVKDHEDMHEDTEEIDALLYSDTEYAYDSDEGSTGHSPSFVEAVEVGDYVTPVKRRRLDVPESDASLVDTASSARALGFHPLLDDDDAAALSRVGSCDEPRDESVGRSHRGKRGRIQMTMDLLRSIVPGGEDKDATALLDEAIRYLKSLRLQANILDATRSTI